MPEAAPQTAIRIEAPLAAGARVVQIPPAVAKKALVGFGAADKSQVAAMVGPGAAGTAYIPGLADYAPMVKGVGSMALGGRTSRSKRGPGSATSGTSRCSPIR